MKKSLKIFTFAFALLFAITVKVNAAELLVGTENDLKDCVKTTGNVCVLTKYINLTSTVEIKDGVDVTISLDKQGGALEITADDSVDPLFKVTDGRLVIDGVGRITGNVDVFSLLGNTTGGTTKAELEIGEGVEVVSNTSNAVYIKGKGAKLDLYGSLVSNSTKYATIQGNGNKESAGTIINIYEGASVKSPNEIAIYHPQDGELNIYGGEITGTTGIEMRAGKLTVKGGTIIGTAVPTITKENGNGSTTTGAGIAIIQHTTELDLSADVSGGTIKGYTALYHNNTENNSEEAAAKVTLSVTGGVFEAISGGTNAIYSDAKENFIEGGEFKGEVDEKFISEELETKEIDGVTFVGNSIPEEEVIEKDNNDSIENNEANPNTVDNVAIFMVVGLISLIGIGLTVNKLRRNA